MEPLLFRVPGTALVWKEVVVRLGAHVSTERLASSPTSMRVDDRPWPDVRRPLPAGALVRLDAPVDSGDDPDRSKARAPGPSTWLALVETPGWRRARLFVGGAVGTGREGSKDRGPATGPPHSPGRKDSRSRGRSTTDGGSLTCVVGERRGALSELRIEGDAGDARAVLEALAADGLPVVGDVRRGGLLVRGGLRLASLSMPTTQPAGDDVHGSASNDRPPPVVPDASGATVSPIDGAASPASPRDGVAWWPDEPILPDPDSVRPRWRVSRAAARAVSKGHPWLLPDAESEPVDRWRPGTLVDAVTGDGDFVGLARIDGPGPISARIWSRPESLSGEGAASGDRSRHGARRRSTVGRSGGDAAVRGASVPDRVATALARRESLAARHRTLSPETRDGRPWTDALRLIHGEADGLPGIAVDRLGPILRVLVTSEGAARALVDPVAASVVDARSGIAGPAEGVLIVTHLRGVGAGRHECVRWWEDGPPEGARALDDRGRLVVHERGLAFAVDPGLSDPWRPRPGVGLFIDQRENRERLAGRARAGGHWLNLFAHTGAFTVALLAAGAEEVVSVDLSKPYLARLDENLVANASQGVDPKRNQSVRRDGRRYLDELPKGQRFAGIVLDPPTAAAAGRRFWSAKRDLLPLVTESLSRLEPGGALLLSRNQRRARGPLADLVRAAAEQRGIALADVEAADPGPDFPRLRGFPEGDSFRGVIATRR